MGVQSPSGSKWLANLPLWVPRWPTEEPYGLRQLVFAIVWFQCCMFFDCLMQVMAEERYIARRDELGILPDLSFDALPHVPANSINDILLFSLAAATAMRLLIKPTGRFVIITRITIIYATLFMVRGFMVVATVLPNPDPTCQPYMPYSNPFQNAWGVFTLNLRTCSDMLYSGHTVGYTMLALVWTFYTRHHIAVKLMVWVYVSMSVGMILATHLHYLCDVIVAIIFTFTSFLWYHWILQKRLMKEPSYRQQWPFLVWLDDNSYPLKPSPQLHPLLRAQQEDERRHRRQSRAASRRGSVFDEDAVLTGGAGGAGRHRNHHRSRPHQSHRAQHGDHASAATPMLADTAGQDTVV